MNTTAEAQPETVRLDLAFEAQPQAAMVLDREGRVCALNARGRKLFEQSDFQVTPGQNLFDHSAGTRATLMQDMIAAASGGRLLVPLPGQERQPPARLRFDVTALRPNGRRAEQFLLIHHHDAVSQAFSALNSQLRIANEIAARQRQQHRQMEINYQIMTQFSHAAAHDLKAPLRNIALLLTYLQDDYGTQIPDGAHEFLDSARDMARRLQTLITDLLAHARAGAGEVTKLDQHIKDVVEDVCFALSSTIKECGALIEIDGAPGTIRADPRLLQQLLDNLISNALKYRSPDRPLVLQLRIESRQGQPHALHLVDNGIGFDNAQRDLIFEPFKRAHIGEGIEGSGIGLATCRTICNRHGWTIQAEGRPGAGAEFRISGLS